MNAKYLNETVWCRVGASAIHGVGVIAIRDIKKGTKLTDYTVFDFIDRKEMPSFFMDEKEFMKIRPEIRSLILDRMFFHEDYNKIGFEFISPNHDQILQSFMNHSSDPNSDGEYALRDIKAGEEVTEDFDAVVEHRMHPINKKHLSFLYGN